MDYSEKLKDPRWQRRRLEIMQRDGWTCLICKSKDKTLHVHHTYYEHGLDPWEYEDYTLKTLCEDCHKSESGLVKTVTEDIIEIVKSYGIFHTEMSAFRDSIGDPYVFEALVMAGKSKEVTLKLMRFCALEIVKADNEE